MHRVTLTSNEKSDSLQSDPDEKSAKSSKSSKSNKTRKPKKPKDRARTTPQMKSRSTSNDSHIANFKVDGSKSPAIPSERIQQKSHLESTELMKHDENFVREKLRGIWVSKYSDILKLKSIQDQLYEMASSATDGGIKLIIEFAQQHNEHRNFIAALGCRAIEEGNTGLFASIRKHAPNRLFESGMQMMLATLDKSSATEADIRHAISVIKMLLKDGVNCAKEEMRKLAEWSRRNGDQELTTLLVRDEKFIGYKLRGIFISEYSDILKLKSIQDQLYEMASSATDGGIKLIIEFAQQHNEHRNFIAALGYRAIEEGNTGLFASIRKHAPNRLFESGMQMMLATLDKSSATEADIRHAISVIKMLLKDGVGCSKEQARTMEDWASKLNDQDLLELLDART
jgi:uncharacterized membrane protein